jgi:hypothetical protein
VLSSIIDLMVLMGKYKKVEEVREKGRKTGFEKHALGRGSS